MTPARLKRRFPWINTDGIALASYGYENEGWFDPWALMSSFRMKAMSMGVTFIKGEVYNMAHKINEDKYYTDADEMEDEYKRIENRCVEAHVHLPDGDVWPIIAPRFVIAAGCESGHIAQLAGLGHGRDILSIPLPVEPRKRYVYVLHAPDGPGLDCPLMIDPSGTYFRREGYGNTYLCGRSPPEEEQEPGIEDLEVDHEFFHEHVWPKLANRVPAMNNLKVGSAFSRNYLLSIFID